MRISLPPEALDATDRLLINRLQDGIALTHAPFADLAAETGEPPEALTARLARLREIGAVIRFGPFLDAAALGGAFCLCAMAVPVTRFDEVMTLVNAHPEVAHNYERDNRLNMWFVLACERVGQITVTAARIGEETGLEVHLFPKEREFFIGFRVEA